MLAKGKNGRFQLKTSGCLLHSSKGKKVVARKSSFLLLLLLKLLRTAVVIYNSRKSTTTQKKREVEKFSAHCQIASGNSLTSTFHKNCSTCPVVVKVPHFSPLFLYWRLLLWKLFYSIKMLFFYFSAAEELARQYVFFCPHLLNQQRLFITWVVGPFQKFDW